MHRVVLLVLVAAGLAQPATAAATPVCSWNLATHVLSVSYTASGGEAVLAVNGSGVIELNKAVCGQTANVNTVDTINVTDTSGKAVKFGLDLNGAGFAPGAAGEAGSPEIEFKVDLGAGMDELDLFTSTGASVTVGQSGVNLDPVQDKAGAPAGVDADMTIAGVESVGFAGSNAAETLDGRGGDGTGSATGLALFANGSPVNDVFHGGSGDDEFRVDGGDDRVDGGAGVDEVNFFSSTIPVTVDLRSSVAQNTGVGLDTISNVENVVGTEFDDTLHGSDGPNRIDGETGKDTIFTGGGHDHVDALDNEADSIDCATGTDVLTTDAIDVLVGCTNTQPDPVPTVTPPAGDPTPTPPATDPTTPAGDQTPTSTPPAGDVTPPTGDATPPGGNGGPTAPHGNTGPDDQAVPAKASVLTVSARKQKRKAIRRHGLRVRLTAPKGGSVAVHAGSAKNVFWALAPGRPLTVRLHVSRRVLRSGRARVTAVLQDAHGAATTVRKTVRLR